MFHTDDCESIDVVNRPRTLQEIEREAILDAMRRHNNRRVPVAGELGIGIRTLYDKLKLYGWKPDL